MRSTLPSRPVRRTPTRVGVFRRSQSSRRRTATSRRSPTSRPRGSACASSSTAPGASRATGASTTRARATRPCARARSRARPAGDAQALAPLEPQRGSFKTTVEIDPFSVSLCEKIDLCLQAERRSRGRRSRWRRRTSRAQLEQKGARHVGGRRDRAGDRRVRRRDRRDSRSGAFSALQWEMSAAINVANSSVRQNESNSRPVLCCKVGLSGLAWVPS